MMRSQFLQSMLIMRDKMMIIADDVVGDVGGDMVVENMRRCTHITNGWTSWTFNTKNEGSFMRYSLRMLIHLTCFSDIVNFLDVGTCCETPRKSNFLKKGKMVILVKIINYSRSQMMKRTSPLESSREI